MLIRSFNPVVFIRDKIIAKQSLGNKDFSCVVVFALNNLILIDCHEARERNRKHTKSTGYCMRSYIQISDSDIKFATSCKSSDKLSNT